MNNMRRLCFLFALVCAATLTQSANAEVVERVVATVNEDPIFLSDLRQRAAPFLSKVAEAPSESERLELLQSLYDQMLSLLIDEELLKDAAVRSKIRVTEQDIDTALRNVQTQNNMTDEQFWQAVQEQGLTRAQYRTDLRRQLLRYKVMNERVRSRVNISEDDIRRRYEDKVRKSEVTLKFRVSHLFFALPADASVTQVADIRTVAEKASKKTNAENFEQAIEEYGGGELGWLSQGDLSEDLERELLTMAPQSISKPIQGATGFHVFLLHERDTGSDMPSFEEQREQLSRQMLDAAMSKQEALYVQELQRKAVIKRML